MINNKVQITNKKFYTYTILKIMPSFGSTENNINNK